MKALYVLTKQMSNHLELHIDAISRIIRKECDDRDLSPVTQRSTQICNEFECNIRKIDYCVIHILARRQEMHEISVGH